MLIILEGVDRTGKSTLAERLADICGADVWHRGKPEAHPLIEYEGALKDYAPGYGPSLVLDRWHVGEGVWPRIFSRESELDHAALTHIDMFLRSRGAVLVYCYRRDTAALLAEYEEHGEPLTPHGLQTARSEYEQLLQVSTVPVLRWSFDDPQCTVSPEFIVNEALNQQRLVRKVHDLTQEWIGSPRPRAILVGDEFGPGHDLERDAAVPFVPYPSTSGHYLLTHAPSWVKSSLIVNSSSGQVYEPLDELTRALNTPPVIALGNRASDALRAQDVEHVRVAHPQYRRRFFFHDHADYRADLRRALHAQEVHACM